MDDRDGWRESRGNLYCQHDLMHNNNEDNNNNINLFAHNNMVSSIPNEIICTQLYGFKYSYLIQIILNITVTLPPLSLYIYIYNTHTQA